MFLNRPVFVPVKDPLTDKLVLDPVTGLPLFTMSEPLRYVGIDGSEVEVPADDISDLGSVPKALRWLLNPHARKWILSFRLHDHDYNTRAGSRYDADTRMFYSALEHDAEFHKALGAWFLLRLFGWTHWRKVSKG
jgi:hypothetical protein